MTRKTRAIAWVLGSVISLGMAAMAMSQQAPPASPEAPSYSIREFGVTPVPVILENLLQMDAVQQELKITDAQKQEQKAIGERQFSKLQKARGENRRDRAKFLVARDAIIKEAAAAVRATLKPEQFQRLDQIQLQAEGPLAFARPDSGPQDSEGTPVAKRLKLTDDQVRRIRAIAEAGEPEIQKAASFPIPLVPKEKPTLAIIEKLVDSPEFQAAKQKASQAGRDTWSTLNRRKEDVLTDDQRATYQKLIGAPFDLSKLRWGRQNGREGDIMMAGQALGIVGGQRADPDFNTKVARPAYATADRHPHVFLDEAHHNFHTAGGRYKPFAELITNDGYRVIPNKEKFSREGLGNGDILVIANALGAEGMGHPDASNPAFTDAECDAVRDWVKAGGSLLFITDHAPMGSAAQSLAKRFGVDMSTGTAMDPSHSDVGPARLVFTRRDGLLGDHPITRGRDASEQINRIMTFTGQSLKGPEGSVAFLKLADTAIDTSVLARRGEGSVTGWAQGLAFPFGKGRVVVLGEAAQVSAQVAGVGRPMGMNVPGIDNRQMALNIMHWLSGLLEPREAALKKAG